MNSIIRDLARESHLDVYGLGKDRDQWEATLENFAELLIQKCADICMEMSAKCAGLEGDGNLAKDCAYWIKRDFGVEE